jgi:hypothetical protein
LRVLSIKLLRKIINILITKLIIEMKNSGKFNYD